MDTPTCSDHASSTTSSYYCSSYYDSFCDAYLSDEDYDTEWSLKHLSTKPSSASGKRTKGRHCSSNAVPGHPPSVIEKTIEDPEKVLSKKRKARVLAKCNDNFTPGIQYTVDKKRRWEQTNGTSFLEFVDSDEVDAQVVVYRMSPPVYYCYERKVTELHELNNEGEVVSKFAKGHGSFLRCLTTIAGEEQLIRDAQHGTAACRTKEKESQNELVVDNARSKAKIRYTFIHDQPLYFGQYMQRRSYPNPFHVSEKRDKFCEWENDEPEQSVLSDDDSCKPSRNLRFCLGDYVQDGAFVRIHARHKRAKKAQHSSDAEELNFAESRAVKPFKLLDVSSVLRKPVTFEYAYVDLAKWANFSYVDQVEALRDRYVVRWLDVNHQRVSIDATSAFLRNEDYQGEPVVVIVIERCWLGRKPYLRVVLNTSVASDKLFTWRKFRDILKQPSICDIRSLVETTLRLPEGWIVHVGATMDGTDWLHLSKEYRPVFNDMGSARPALRLTYESMATRLRMECERIDSTPFEKITQISFNNELRKEASEAVNNVNIIVPTGAKCRECGSDRGHNLYEMDDCWMCRSCLKQLAIHQIRVKSLPINLPLVVPEGTTSYDVLSSIFPLSLLTFYTKMAAVKLFKEFMSNMTVLMECPGCKQTVATVKSNEYKCLYCECGIVWCTWCKKEPHWPMSCEAAAEWKLRRKHYSLEADGLTQRLREITCSCLGSPILVACSERRAECQNCSTVFDPSSMYIISKNGISSFGKFNPVKDKLLPTIHIPSIRKGDFRACEKARCYRFDTKKLNELGKACRKAGDTVTELKSLRDLRQKVLYIIEYGIAWINVEEPVAGRTVIRAKLLQLLRRYEEITTTGYQRINILDSVQALKVAVQKTISLIEKNL